MHLYLYDHYPPQLYKWVCGTTQEVLRKVNCEGLGNTTSLLDVKTDSCLMEVMVDLWDPKA